MFPHGVKSQVDCLVDALERADLEKYPAILRQYTFDTVAEVSYKISVGKLELPQLTAVRSTFSRVEFSTQEFYDFYAATHLISYLECAPSATTNLILDVIDGFASKLIKGIKETILIRLDKDLLVETFGAIQQQYGSIREFFKLKNDYKLTVSELLSLEGRNYVWRNISEKAVELERSLPATTTNVTNVVFLTDHLVHISHARGLLFGIHILISEVPADKVKEFFNQKTQQWDWDFYKVHSPRMYNIYQQLKRRCG